MNKMVTEDLADDAVALVRQLLLAEHLCLPLDPSRRFHKTRLCRVGVVLRDHCAAVDFLRISIYIYIYIYM